MKVKVLRRSYTGMNSLIGTAVLEATRDSAMRVHVKTSELIAHGANPTEFEDDGADGMGWPFFEQDIEIVEE